MPGVPRLHLLRVFCDGETGGNPLAVFLDGGEVPAERRQEVAADLGLSETVFVDDPACGELRIFTPGVELDFAGHPTVGAAWLLRREHGRVESLRPPAGEVAVRYEDELAFVAAKPAWGPPHEWQQLASPDEIDALEGPPGERDLMAVWGWLDEPGGVVRARVFLPGLGIAEDEATGSAALLLCEQLGRPLDIRQGSGSRILARPLASGYVEIGGRSLLDEVRDY